LRRLNHSAFWLLFCTELRKWVTLHVCRKPGGGRHNDARLKR